MHVETRLSPPVAVQHCRVQASPTAGPLFAGTKLPVTKRFLPMYPSRKAKNGIAPLPLKRQLGVSNPTAWLMHQMIMKAKDSCDPQHRLSGAIQVDDAYPSGERTGDKQGQGSESRIAVFTAASLIDKGRPRHVKLPLVFSVLDNVTSMGPTSILDAGDRRAQRPPSTLHSRVQCGLRSDRVRHPPIVAPRPAEVQVGQSASGNIKSTFSCAYKARRDSTYADRYRGACAYCFNRGVNQAGLAPRTGSSTSITHRQRHSASFGTVRSLFNVGTLMN